MMPTICPRCTHVNPGNAQYCYHDGVALAGSTAGPLDMARQPFARPFVFPSGQVCRNFDEFVLACEQRGPEAADLLHKGYLQQFLASLGRLDLAVAAQEAARFPDRERGLDQLLSRLPSQTVPPPRLEVRPLQVPLGRLNAGQDYQFAIELHNAGRRLLYGSVTSDCAWLVPGDNNASARLIQFGRTLSVTVRVRGQHLRAGTRPMEGHLLVETNGGSHMITVTAEVPPRPFGEGVLAGALTPRDLAKHAMKDPHQAAPLFESGAVARWYQANGWPYPVQTPTSSGLGAVQQFFEALGLTKAPRVDVSEAQVRLHGPPGTRLTHQVVVYTSEGRPVYAHAVSSDPSLTVYRTVCRGSVATIPVEVAVPNQPGASLVAMLHIVANGGQRFQVPVAVTAQAGAPIPVQTTPVTPASPKPVPPSGVRPPAPPTAAGALTRHDLIPVAVLGVFLLALIIVDMLRDLPRRQVLAVRDAGEFRVQVQDEPDEGGPGLPSFKIEDEPEERTGKPLPVKYEIKDEPGESGPAALPIDPTPRVKYALRSPPGFPPPPVQLSDGRQGPNTQIMPNKGIPSPSNPLSFGISATAAAKGAENKLLTWSANGLSNCTLVGIDGALSELGSGAGRTVRFASTELVEGVEPTPGAVSPSQSTWVVGANPDGSGGLRFHQVLEVVPGQTSGTGKAARRLLDTVLVRWMIENRGGAARKVALRLNLDTLIGSNDGVPFTVPGRPGLVSTCADFPEARTVPDFVQALEVADLHAPGTIAHMTLKVGGKVEPPDRVSLTFQQFWGLGFDPVRNWSYPIENMRNDSAVVLYWSDKDIPAGGKRTIGFAYGLGQIASSDKLGITLGGSFDIGQAFTVTAYVEKPQAGQTLRLQLPDGLALVNGAQTQAVAPAPAGGTSLVTWKVRVDRTGTFRLVVNSSTGLSQAKTLTIAQAEGGKLALDLTGSFVPGQKFRVIAKVTDPVAGQKLTLQLPPGLQRSDGDAEKAIPDGAGKQATVEWEVRVLNAGKFPVRVVSSTGVAQTKTLTIAQPGSGANFTMALKGEFEPGKVFTVSAKVTNPAPDQALTLQLPDGLQRVEGEERQPVPPGGESTLSWKVKILKPGTYPVRMASSTGITQRKTLLIEPPGDQPGRFTFEFDGKIRPGKEFTVTARVPTPVAGQTLKLVLPEAMQLAGSEAQQVVPAASGGPAAVVWRVRVLAGGRLPVRVESSTGLRRTKTITLTESTGKSAFGR
jgi:hypothetical protein